jgi:IS605 OrfB family transposase
VQRRAKGHQKVRRQRQDLQHKTALALMRQYDRVYHEDLQTANLVKNHSLAKSITDAGWSAFLSILSVKAACASRRGIAVPPAYTSHACSGCGVRIPKGVSVRWHRCPDCGTSLHRDHNAALNILRLGQERRGAGQTPQARTWTTLAERRLSISRMYPGECQSPLCAACDKNEPSCVRSVTRGA